MAACHRTSHVSTADITNRGKQHKDSPMRRLEVGNRVRIDIPDKNDPDYERLHRKRGTIVEIFEDDAGQETGDPRDSYLFTVEIDDGEVEHLRWRDPRPATDS